MPVRENFQDDVSFELALRDYFAAKAMAGILAGKSSNEDMWCDEEPDVTATQAYERADAMIARRKAVQS